MRHPSPLLLLHLLTWLLALTTPIHAGGPESAVESTSERLIPPLAEPLERLTHSLSATQMQVKKAVQKAPEKLNLGADNFLGSGLKRKSVSGAYGTTAAVGVGAAAITYQTMNLRSKSRDAAKKAEKDARVKEAICAARRGRAQQGQGVAPEEVADDASSVLALPDDDGAQSNAAPQPASAAEGEASSSLPYPSTRWTKRAASRRGVYAYPPSRALLARFAKRTPISDATLTTIEDYNKMIGATEAIASGTIAVASADQANQRSLKASAEFHC